MNEHVLILLIAIIAFGILFKLLYHVAQDKRDFTKYHSDFSDEDEEEPLNQIK